MKLDKISKITLIIAGLLICFSFIAPILFVQESSLNYDFTHTGEIGDTIGGLMSPFIALAAVFVTFLAFYIQFQANQLQRTLFRQELDSNKFENQFYEMLRLHKENVNEISITIKSSYYSGREEIRNEREINGRAVFKHFLYEIAILYNVAKKSYKGWNNKELINRAYSTFFNGLDLAKSNILIESDRTYIEELEKIQNVKNVTEFNNIINGYNIKLEWCNFKLFDGSSSHLGHYYRHLFQTVKFVANQSEDFLNYAEKRKYLRIVRAQLANQEQAMLFYNWIAGFGSKWENNENKFFTDYRMIHNLYNKMLLEDFDLVEIFNIQETDNYQHEPNRDDDKLFGFEDYK